MSEVIKTTPDFDFTTNNPSLTSQELYDFLQMSKIQNIYTEFTKTHTFTYQVKPFNTPEEIIQYAITATQGNCHILNLRLQYLLEQG
jgi:hypothetical protein